MYTDQDSDAGNVRHFLYRDDEMIFGMRRMRMMRQRSRHPS